MYIYFHMTDTISEEVCCSYQSRGDYATKCQERFGPFRPIITMFTCVFCCCCCTCDIRRGY